MTTIRPEQQVDAVIDRMREAAGMRTDLALSADLGLGKAAVANWRRRRHVPYAECVMLAIRESVSLEWLLLGTGMRAKASPLPADNLSDAALSGGDPRAARLVAFVAMWRATHDADDLAWLERTIARAVPEYGAWLASQKH